MNIVGYISDYDGEKLTIIAPFDRGYLLAKRQITGCEVRLDDGRRLSAEQRKKIYASMRDIADYTGYTPEQVKALWKYDFIAKTGCDYFSLSDCNMTTANEFLSYLIDFCLEHDIPTIDSLLERSPDISRYLYSCLIHKRCCITQKNAQLHHVDAVGMGRDRKDIVHVGMRVMPLHWKLHREAHTIGQKTFNEKYHIYGIKADEDICKIWKIPT